MIAMKKRIPNESQRGFILIVAMLVIASLLGILILHEPFTWRYLLGLIMTVAGVALIVFR